MCVWVCFWQRVLPVVCVCMRERERVVKQLSGIQLPHTILYCIGCNVQPPLLLTRVLLLREWKEMLSEVADMQSLLASLQHNAYYDNFKVCRC